MKLTTSVVTWNNGLVLSHSVDISLNNAAKESCVQVAVVIRITIARCSYAGVDASGIAMPKIHVHGGDRLARARIHQLDVEVERDTLLILRNIATDEFTIDVVRTLSYFRLQNAGRIIREEQCLIIAIRDARSRLVSEIVGRKVAAHQRAVETALGARLLGHLLAASKSSLEVASALELGSARADRVGTSLHELGALSCFFGQVVARMRQRGGQGKKTKGQERLE